MENLLETSSSPLVLVVGIIVAAWIWEDASLIAAALIAAEGRLGVSAAVIAVFIGICSGDLGLYYLGRAAHRWRRFRGWILTNPASRDLGRRFRRKTMSNIVLIRFIPGLRTLGFTLCGVWRIELGRFLMAMSVAGIVWIALMFTLIYRVGTADWLRESQWKWALMSVALLLLIFNNLWAQRNARRKVLK